ncbi:MAG: MBL fold metallo-hydrolase [Runella sp.]
MEITLLGTGTSSGVPLIGCSCEVCRSLDYRDKRLRVSVHIEVEGKSFVIDTGPDFRQQMLRQGIKSLDAVLFTHQHKDHTAGLDDVRAYNFLHQRDIPVYATAEVLTQIQAEFSYIFAEKRYPGIPRLKLHEISSESFEVEGVVITPIKVWHHKLPVLGFRIGDFAYITDVNHIPESEIAKLQNLKILVLGALQRTPHLSHYTLEQAVEVAQSLQAHKTYFTHISHKMGLHAAVEKELPPNIHLAFDGLCICI